VTKTVTAPFVFLKNFRIVLLSNLFYNLFYNPNTDDTFPKNDVMLSLTSVSPNSSKI
jgi:predicted lactoylglutathione lyase